MEIPVSVTNLDATATTVATARRDCSQVEASIQVPVTASDKPNKITLVALRRDYCISVVITNSTSYVWPVQETNATSTAELVL